MTQDMNEESVVDANQHQDDQTVETALRPKNIDEFIKSPLQNIKVKNIINLYDILGIDAVYIKWLLMQSLLWYIAPTLFRRLYGHEITATKLLNCHCGQQPQHYLCCCENSYFSARY